MKARPIYDPLAPVKREDVLERVAIDAVRINDQLLSTNALSPEQRDEIYFALVVRRRLLDRVRHASAGKPAGIEAEARFQTVDRLLVNFESRPDIIEAGNHWSAVAACGVPLHPETAAFGNWFIAEAERLRTAKGET